MPRDANVTVLEINWLALSLNCHMRSTILVLLVIVMSMIFIAILTKFAKFLRLVDMPDTRKQHDKPVPLVGGLAIYLVILFATFIFDLASEFLWLMIPASIVLGVGLFDDALRLSVKVRFAVQILVSSIPIIQSSLWIRSIGVNEIDLESFFGYFGIPLTIFAIVGLTNAFNMVDGIDGLASGHMIVGLVTLCGTIYITQGHIQHFEWLVIMTASVFGFSIVNLSLTPLKKVFLGDGGSLFLGFTMGWFLIYYSQSSPASIHAIAALWCVTIPVFDTLAVIARRVKNKKHPFSGDRNHLHHILVDRGVSPRITLYLILGLSILVNSIGIWMTYVISPLMSLITYGILFLGFGYATLHPIIPKKPALSIKKGNRVD